MKQGFNFLKPQVEAPSIWSSVYSWTVNTARIILIITEAAVIIALILRIIVDVQSKDLDEKVKNYENALSLRKTEEQKYLTLQSKTTTYKEAYEKLPAYKNILTELFNNIPKEFLKTNISIQNTSISLTGIAYEADIKTMEEYLKNSPLFYDSKLTSLNLTSTSKDNLATFTFNTNIKELESRKLDLLTDN